MFGDLLVREQQQRRIPGGDRNAYAKRFATREVERLLLVDRNEGALDLVGEAAEIIVVLRNVAKLAELFCNQLAVIGDFDARELFRVARDQIAEAGQQPAALARAEAASGGRAQRGVGRLDRARRVVGVPRGRLAHALPVYGLIDSKRAPPAESIHALLTCILYWTIPVMFFSQSRK